VIPQSDAVVLPVFTSAANAVAGVPTWTERLLGTMAAAIVVVVGDGGGSGGGRGGGGNGDGPDPRGSPFRQYTLSGHSEQYPRSPQV
jgi:hypothetical protein